MDQVPIFTLCILYPYRVVVNNGMLWGKCHLIQSGSGEGRVVFDVGGVIAGGADVNKRSLDGVGRTYCEFRRSCRDPKNTYFYLIIIY